MAFKIKIPDEILNKIYTFASDAQTAEFAWEAVGNLQARGRSEGLKNGYWEYTDPTGVLKRDMVLTTFIGTTELNPPVIVEGLELYLEMTKTDFENNEVLAGLPNRTYLDENEVEQVHTWKSWATDDIQYTFRENVAGDRVVFSARPKGQNSLSNLEFLPIYGAVQGGADIVIHMNNSYKENILSNGLWVNQE